MGQKSRHIPPQTDPTVGLFRNMSRFFLYIASVNVSADGAQRRGKTATHSSTN